MTWFERKDLPYLLVGFILLAGFIGFAIYYW